MIGANNVTRLFLAVILAGAGGCATRAEPSSMPYLPGATQHLSLTDIDLLVRVSGATTTYSVSCTVALTKAPDGPLDFGFLLMSKGHVVGHIVSDRSFFSNSAVDKTDCATHGEVSLPNTTAIDGLQAVEIVPTQLHPRSNASGY